MTQPEALRLANRIDTQDYFLADVQAAAEELRRLHAENEYLAGEVKNCTTNQMRTIDLISSEFKDLREKNTELVEALRWYVDNDEVMEMEDNQYWLDGRDRARAALAKAGDAAIRSRT